MDAKSPTLRLAACCCAVSLLAPAGPARAQSSAQPSVQPATTAPSNRQEAAAARRVGEAAAVIGRMEVEPRMKQLLQQAKGVFIIPDYVRAALGIGAVGGAGVLLVKRSDGTWSDPAFYNIGGINVGAQAGAEGGPVTLLLNNEAAVAKFMQKNEFSLNADAGLTIVSWSKVAQGTAGAGDITAWAGTEGLFGNVASIGINGIRYSQGATNAYYRQSATAADVIAGRYENPQSAPLKQAMAKAASKY